MKRRTWVSGPAAKQCGHSEICCEWLLGSSLKVGKVGGEREEVDKTLVRISVLAIIEVTSVRGHKGERSQG